MKIIEQIINKKLELSEEGFINKNYLRGMWNFYVGYSISLSYLQEQDQLLARKLMLWRKFLMKPEQADSRRFKELQQHRIIDMNKISETFTKIEQEKEIAGEFYGEFYKKGTIAIISYSHPEELR